MKKKIIVILILVLTVGIVLCGSKLLSGHNNKTDIEIGIITDGSSINQHLLDGLNYSLRENYKKGIIKEKIVLKDVSIDDDLSTVEFQQIENQYVLFDLCGNEIVDKHNEIISKQLDNHIFIVPFYTKAVGDKSWIINASKEEQAQARSLYKFVDRDFHPRNIGIIIDVSSKYAKRMKKWIKNEYINNNIIVKEIPYIPVENDSNITITSESVKNLDVIYILGYAHEAGSIISKIRSQNNMVPIVGADILDDDELKRITRNKYLSDVYYISDFYISDYDEILQDKSFQEANLKINKYTLEGCYWGNKICSILAEVDMDKESFGQKLKDKMERIPKEYFYEYKDGVKFVKNTLR